MQRPLCAGGQLLPPDRAGHARHLAGTAVGDCQPRARSAPAASGPFPGLSRVVPAVDRQGDGDLSARPDPKRRRLAGAAPRPGRYRRTARPVAACGSGCDRALCPVPPWRGGGGRAQVRPPGLSHGRAAVGRAGCRPRRCGGDPARRTWCCDGAESCRCHGVRRPGNPGVARYPDQFGSRDAAAFCAVVAAVRSVRPAAARGCGGDVPRRRRGVRPPRPRVLRQPLQPSLLPPRSKDRSKNRSR